MHTYAKRSDAFGIVGLKEIQASVWLLYEFCFPCPRFWVKAFSLILLVSPYTDWPRAMNYLFVSPDVKMLRHYLFPLHFQYVSPLFFLSLVDQPLRFFSERTSSPKWALNSIDIWARSQGCLTHGLLLCLLFSDCSHRSTFTWNGVRMLAMPICYCRLQSQPKNSNEPVRTK